MPRLHSKLWLYFAFGPDKQSTGRQPPSYGVLHMGEPVCSNNDEIKDYSRTAEWLS